LSEFTAKEFNDNLVQGKLIGNKCKTCGSLHLPPRRICSHCGSQNFESIRFKGEGTIEAVTLNTIPSSGFRSRAPYVVGIIRLDEGASISGLILVNGAKNYEIGRKVALSIIKEGEKSILGFKPL
jgi:uncharacterized OB-fold protein